MNIAEFFTNYQPEQPLGNALNVRTFAPMFIDLCFRVFKGLNEHTEIKVEPFQYSKVFVSQGKNVEMQRYTDYNKSMTVVVSAVMVFVHDTNTLYILKDSVVVFRR